jgi:hypothetical protein
MLRTLRHRFIRLNLEHLEDRRLLSADVTAAFIASAYHTMLNRAPTANDLTYWSGQAQSNGLDGVLAGIEASPEHQSVEVRNMYETILGRQARPDEVAYWTNLMQSGASGDSVKADILGSDEFYQRAHNSPDNFVNALYQGDMGRTADAGGLAYWDSLLSQGDSRTQVAAGIIDSPEALAKDVQGAYSLYLGRSADPGSLGYWEDQIAANPSLSSIDVLSAGMLGSGEGVARLSDFVNSSPTSGWTSDPNVLAGDYLGGQFNSDWQLPTTSTAADSWSAVNYDPWLPVSYNQTPAGGANWSSYVGDPIDNTAFWNSIGAGYDTSTFDRPVGTYNDLTGYLTTPQTASSITNYPDGYNIRIFPGEYLASYGGSSGTGDYYGGSSYTGSDGSGSSGPSTYGYDENLPKEPGYPTVGSSYDTSNPYSSDYGGSNGYDSGAAYNLPSYDPYSGMDLQAGQDVPYMYDSSY